VAQAERPPLPTAAIPKRPNSFFTEALPATNRALTRRQRRFARFDSEQRSGRPPPARARTRRGRLSTCPAGLFYSPDPIAESLRRHVRALTIATAAGAAIGTELSTAAPLPPVRGDELWIRLRKAELVHDGRRIRRGGRRLQPALPGRSPRLPQRRSVAADGLAAAAACWRSVYLPWRLLILFAGLSPYLSP
jgi:hypothetical protein